MCDLRERERVDRKHVRTVNQSLSRMRSSGEREQTESSRLCGIASPSQPNTKQLAWNRLPSLGHNALQLVPHVSLPAEEGIEVSGGVGGSAEVRVVEVEEQVEAREEREGG